MARAIEDLGFDALWVGEHLLYRWPDRAPRGPWEAWTMMAGLAAATTPGHDRAARRLHELPQPGPPREAGRDDRRDRRRPVRPRPRRGLERDGVPGVRLPVRPPRSTGSRRRSRSSGRSSRRARSTSTGASTRPATASCCPRPRPGGPPLLIGSNGPRMLRITLPHVDAWNTWYADTDNTPAGVAPPARHRRRRLPGRRARSGRDRADRRRPRPAAGRPRPDDGRRRDGDADRAARGRAGGDGRRAPGLRRGRDRRGPGSSSTRSTGASIERFAPVLADPRSRPS